MAMSNETMHLTQRDTSNFFVRFIKYFIPWKGDGAGEVVRKFVFMFSIVMFCMSLGQLKDFLMADEQEKTYMQEVIIKYEPDFSDEVDYSVNTGGDDIDIASPESSKKKREIQEWAKPLLERNEDVVGWIKIPGFKNSDGDEYINFPVLQGPDNKYYLYKNLDKQYYESGSIYADAWSVIDEDGQSDNITIFGHHMRYVGTSFTHLAEYKKGVDFLKKYPVIEFNTIYESNCKYVIVSCFVANIYEEQDSGNLFVYNGYRYFDDDEYSFEGWYDEITKRSWYSNDIECSADDKYITLSTCSNETKDLRWVIVAKKMTVNDNLDHIVESYEDKANKDVYFPKCWRDLYGNNKKDFGWAY
ncbi:MAG: class B sortase [Ruminococcus sp.]|nr:class B sortase [Ruminococcus sp.]